MLRNRSELAAVFAGGCAGAIARALLAEAWAHDPSAWPWATLAANVAGALILGWVTTRVPGPSLRRPLLGAGFCGALTTFSTMQLELLEMLDAEHYALAAGYAAASMGAGLAAVAVATQAGRRRRAAR